MDKKKARPIANYTPGNWYVSDKKQKEREELKKLLPFDPDITKEELAAYNERLTQWHKERELQKQVEKEAQERKRQARRERKQNAKKEKGG